MIRRKQFWGILLICVSILGMTIWEHWGKERFLYDEILVLKENVQKGTIITEKMLGSKTMDLDEPCLKASEKEKILGLQTAVFVHKGVPLFSDYFGEPDLMPDESKNRYGMCLPTEWIASRPTTLSKGDKVFLFCGKELVTQADVSQVTKDGAVEIIVGKEQAAAICQVTADGGHLALLYQ